MESARPLSPVSVAMFDYWRSKRAGDSLPLRSDIDIIPEVPQLARYVYLVEVLGPSHYCYRVVGSTIVDTAGRDLTGRTIDTNLYPATAAEHIGALDFVVQNARPGIIRGRPRGFPSDEARIEIIGLPLLAAPNGPVSFVMGTLSILSGDWVHQLRAQRTGHTTFDLFALSHLEGPNGTLELERPVNPPEPFNQET